MVRQAIIKALKSTAYTTLVWPQLEYASTVWSPHTATDSTKLEAVQRSATRWATRDYQHTSSVTQMIKDLNWRPLEQRHIDSGLILMYKITYDLVAADYLIPNTRQSRHNQKISLQANPNTQRLLQVHILSPHHWNTLQFYICGTIILFSHAVC